MSGVEDSDEYGGAVAQQNWGTTNLPRKTVPLMKGVSRDEVDVEDDGTHSGPAVYRETDKKYTGSAGMQHNYLAMYCPCGHFIRRVTYDGKKERVSCEGAIA